ncbi:zinc ribbon domain-containing protein [uncultured Methanobrevibacter sp.]|uniref:zinc ribbon domain-containing protein n=1 Tax=uncultured Methanobrevibacter sp. TaxID=253161 RepID=UPI0025D8F3DE|nr:zinc ribbon domain-containing protein [uncultured Methanobrevibacter sp.]
MKKMYCRKCGYKILDSDTEFCPRCGTRVNDYHEVEKIEKNNRIRNILLIVLIIAIIASILIISTGFIMNQQQDKNPMLSNVKFALGDFDTLAFTADLNPTRDYDYLSIEVEYYDSNNNMIDKNPIVWNQNNVKAGQPIKINNPTAMSYYGKTVPAKAIIKVYDSVYSKEPIQTMEVAIDGTNNNNTNNNKDSSQTSDTSNQKPALAYKSDGTPMYSQSEVNNYMSHKYGEVDYHIQDNGYISIDDPHYTSDGHRIY